MAKSETLVFIPAWNEEENLAAVLDELASGLPGADVVVIDDGSTDDTAAVARAHGADVVSFGENRGLRVGIAAGYNTRRNTATSSWDASTRTASIRSPSSHGCSRSSEQARPTSPSARGSPPPTATRPPVCPVSQPPRRDLRPAPRHARHARPAIPRRDERDVRGQPARATCTRPSLYERRAGGRVAAPAPRCGTRRGRGPGSHARAREWPVEASREHGRPSRTHGRRHPARVRGLAEAPAEVSARLVAVLGFSDGRTTGLHPVCAARLAQAERLVRSEDVVLFSGWARRRALESEADLMARAWRSARSRAGRRPRGAHDARERGRHGTPGTPARGGRSRRRHVELARAARLGVASRSPSRQRHLDPRRKVRQPPAPVYRLRELASWIFVPLLAVVAARTR